MAQGIRAGPTRLMMRSTISFAPPESASSLPSIAPSAISSPTLPNVVPSPSMKAWRTSRGGTQATTPSTPVPIINARKGWNFAQTIRTTTAAIARTAAVSSWALPASLNGGSVASTGVPETNISVPLFGWD